VLSCCYSICFVYRCVLHSITQVLNLLPHISLISKRIPMCFFGNHIQIQGFRFYSQYISTSIVISGKLMVDLKKWAMRLLWNHWKVTCSDCYLVLWQTIVSGITTDYHNAFNNYLSRCNLIITFYLLQIWI